jgi:hypothetical protein
LSKELRASVLEKPAGGDFLSACFQILGGKRAQPMGHTKRSKIGIKNPANGGVGFH